MILDVSKYMNKIISIDPDARTAIVQPGVVLSDLQAAAAVHGLRFGPDPSTATRCTIGGMIGNNACGPHGLAYGRTADNVRGLRWLSGDGQVLEVGAGGNSPTRFPGSPSLSLPIFPSCVPNSVASADRFPATASNTCSRKTAGTSPQR